MEPLRAENPARFPAIGWWHSHLPAITAILAPIMICALAVMFYQLVDTTNRLRADERASQERRTLLLQILSNHQDVETGQRGFIITGNDDFLEPYDVGLDELERTFQRLKSSARRDAVTMQRIARVEGLSRKKLNFSAQTVALTRRGNDRIADQLVENGQGKALMDSIRSEIAVLIHNEEARLSATATQSTAAILRLRIISFGFLALLMLLLGAASVAIWHTMNARQRIIRALDDAGRRSAALLDSAMDGIIIFRPDGAMEGMNRAATRMFGLNEADIAGRNIGMLYAEQPEADYARRELASMDLLPGGEGVIRHGRARHVDGRSFPVDVAITLADLAGGARYMAVVRDVSEREKVERLKTEFVATVSHELRTPLASVSASLALILGGATGEINERTRHLVTLAHRNGERLVKLVNHILDLEKLDAGQMDFIIGAHQLRPIVDHALCDLAPFADKHDVTITVCETGDPWVKCDPDRLTQVAINLLSNAIKFSPRGGRVSVEFAPDGFRVSDQGAGVPVSHRERIFERFSQVDASDSREKGGTGLGLAIVRDMLARMNGTIGYEEHANAGAVFRVTLDAAEKPL